MSKVNHRIKPIFEFKSLIYDYNILIYIKTILNYNRIVYKIYIVNILIN